MWFALRSVALAAIGIAMAACSSGGFLREGVGTNLYTPGAVPAAELQAAYAQLICRQANLDCSAPLPDYEWKVFVLAGMNDIDRRCDEYLAWLYGKKSRKDPILKQITDTSTAVNALLQATGSEGSIPILAAVFGFASNSFSNFQSLLLTVNQSTVQAVVLGSQNRLRGELNQITINNFPYAMYVLRSYLRVCMPFTIESKINNNLVTFEQGGAAAVERFPMVTTIPAPPIFRATEAPPITPPPVQRMEGAIGPVEGAISLPVGRAIQRALCVAEDGNFGAENSPTRRALGQFYSAQYYPSVVAISVIATDADLGRLRDARRTFPSCSDAGFRNAFEVGLFSGADVSGKVNPMGRVASVIAALQAASLPVPDGLNAQSFGPSVVAALREAIPNLRLQYGLPGAPELDFQLFDRIVRSGLR